MVPDTSRTSVPGSTLSSFPTMTTLPAAKATSVTASSFWEGSITRPPRRTKSKGIVISECDSEGSGGSTSVAQDHALPRLAHQIEHALDDTRAITAPWDRPELGGTNGENSAHASIFLGNEHDDLSLGRVAIRNPGAHEPKMPNVSKFRATKPRIEDADVHVRFGSWPRENSDVQSAYRNSVSISSV